MQNALRPATSITTGARSTIGARAGGGQYTAGNAERSDFYRSFGVVDRDGQKPGGVDAARGARGRGRWFTSGLDLDAFKADPKTVAVWSMPALPYCLGSMCS